MRLFKTVCCAAALVAFLAPGARADEWNKLTYFTFSGPVQIPGVQLPAGTYMFKLADPDTGRRIVQVRDKAGTKIFATVLSLQNTRLDPARKPLVMFNEKPSGEAPAVQAWFYPSETIGYEFIYPKAQAVKIAKASHTPVAALADNSTDEKSLAGAKIVHVDANGVISGDESFKPGDAHNAATAAPAATIAENNAQAAQTTGTTGTAAKVLPRTASPLELLELLSALSLAGALGARQLRKRFADSL